MPPSLHHPRWANNKLFTLLCWAPSTFQIPRQQRTSCLSLTLNPSTESTKEAVTGWSELTLTNPQGSEVTLKSVINAAEELDEAKWLGGASRLRSLNLGSLGGYWGTLGNSLLSVVFVF